MRIGIYGGSFDPVHYGHLLLAEACREQCRLDEVWFLPAAVAPHKRDREPAAAEHRAAMLDLATAGHPAFRVSRYEIDRGGVNYTVETLEHFTAEDASRELFLLVGADMLNDLPNWRRAKDVCRLALPVAVRRAGSPPVDFDCLRPLVSPDRLERDPCPRRRHARDRPEQHALAPTRRRRPQHPLHDAAGGGDVYRDAGAVSRREDRRQKTGDRR